MSLFKALLSCQECTLLLISLTSAFSVFSWVIIAIYCTSFINSTKLNFVLQYLGISLAKQIYASPKWLNLKRNQWLLVASVILASAVGTYCSLLLTGNNPAWSISQAFKWCARREYIHVDTTPFYSLTRYSGATFGLGLGLTSR